MSHFCWWSKCIVFNDKALAFPIVWLLAEKIVLEIYMIMVSVLYILSQNIYVHMRNCASARKTFVKEIIYFFQSQCFVVRHLTSDNISVIISSTPKTCSTFTWWGTNTRLIAVHTTGVLYSKTSDSFGWAIDVLSFCNMTLTLTTCAVNI